MLRRSLVRQIVLLILALLCVLIGMLALPLPFPAGLFFNLLAVALLLMASPPLQRWFHRLRGRHERLDRAVRTVERHLPKMMRHALNGGQPSRTEQR